MSIHINTDYRLRCDADIVIGDKDSHLYRLKLQAVDIDNGMVLMLSDFDETGIWVEPKNLIEDED